MTVVLNGIFWVLRPGVLPWRDCQYPAETSLLAQSYLARDLVERFFNKIKHCRQIATRYDKSPPNWLVFIKLVSIRLWLRVNESSPRSDSSRRRGPVRTDNCWERR
jgi:transposase